MTKQLSLIETLAAVEMGCEWEYDIAGPDTSKMNLVISVDQSLRHAMKIISENRALRLTAKEWDWPVCMRENLICWVRDRSNTWLKGWNRSFRTSQTEAILGSSFRDFVVPDPRNPDTPPPSDWSPEGKRVVK